VLTSSNIINPQKEDCPDEEEKCYVAKVTWSLGHRNRWGRGCCTDLTNFPVACDDFHGDIETDKGETEAILDMRT
jgi:hypothetical protein